MDFEKWKTALAQRLEAVGVVNEGDGKGYIAATGNECWIEMYRDGLTPSEAAHEELDAARR